MEILELIVEMKLLEHRLTLYEEKKIIGPGNLCPFSAWVIISLAFLRKSQFTTLPPAGQNLSSN